MSQRPWKGEAFEGSLPGGCSGCELSLDRHFLLVRLPSGGTMKLDLRRARVERTGPGGKAWALVSECSGGLTVVTEDERGRAAAAVIASLGGGLSGRSSPRPRSASRHALNRTQKAVLVAAVLVLIAGVIPILMAGPLARVVVAGVPISQDVELGTNGRLQAMQRMSFRQRPMVREEPEIRAAIDVIVARLGKAREDRRFELHVDVVESPIVNAFALPGGNILVSSGLLRELESPEELAGVLAHEITHVVRRHVIEHLVRGAGLGIIAAGLLGNGRSVARTIAAGATILGTIAFTRSMEQEADRDGVRLLLAARIDPRGMVRFLERLAGRERGLQLPELARTHPLTAERVADVTRLIDREGRGDGEPLAIDMGQWTSLQETVRRPPPHSSSDSRRAASGAAVEAGNFLETSR